MVCSGDAIPAKTLCRVLAFFNLFVGLLSIYYWELLSSFTDKIYSASRWDSVFHMNDNIRETLLQKCGPNYLSSINPRQFGSLFRQSIQFYIAACVAFSVKGSVLFFVTCFNPVLAKRFSYGILLLDALTCGLLLYGLYIFRSPSLCLLEHTDILYHPRQQTIVTVAILGFLMVFKPIEYTSLMCFICDQNKLIAAGETRSKGARRSDAFRTPMTSRANSLYGYKGFTGGYCRIDKNNNAKVQMPDELAVALQQINSDDEEEDEDQEHAKFCEDIKRGLLNCKDFVEIDLNDNENNNDQGPHTGLESTITVLHVHPRNSYPNRGQVKNDICSKQPQQTSSTSTNLKPSEHDDNGGIPKNVLG